MGHADLFRNGTMQTSKGIQDMCIEYEREIFEVGVWVQVYWGKKYLENHPKIFLC